MLGALYAGKTPIWASGHCLTLSENMVAGKEAALDRVVIVPWHLRPSALLSTAGMTLVKLCRLPWGTFEPEGNRNSSSIPQSSGTARLTNWQDLWYHGKGIIPVPLGSQLSHASLLERICD